MSDTRTVRVPASVQHEGIYFSEVTLEWRCPVCDGERGEPSGTFSYDGSRRLWCHGWQNACGHVDKYEAVRKEARLNGLNPHLTSRHNQPA